MNPGDFFSRPKYLCVRVKTNSFKLDKILLRLLYFYGLDSNHEPLIKLGETRVILSKSLIVR